MCRKFSLTIKQKIISMKQYTFKDGIKIIASTTEEAKAKHKALANKEDVTEIRKLLEDMGITNDNIKYSDVFGPYRLVLEWEHDNFSYKVLAEIIKQDDNYWFSNNFSNFKCIINKSNIKKIKDDINKSIQKEIEQMKKDITYLNSVKL